MIWWGRRGGSEGFFAYWCCGVSLYGRAPEFSYYLYAFIFHPSSVIGLWEQWKLERAWNVNVLLPHFTVSRINRKIRIILRVLRFICAKLEINCHWSVVPLDHFIAECLSTFDVHGSRIMRPALFTLNDYIYCSSWHRFIASPLWRIHSSLRQREIRILFRAFRAFILLRSACPHIVQLPSVLGGRTYVCMGACYYIRSQWYCNKA